MMPTINEKECQKAGLDEKELLKVARRVERAIKDLNKLGVQFFAGSSCTMRFYDGHEQMLIVGEFSVLHADGGDGATWEDEEGFVRGE